MKVSALSWMVAAVTALTLLCSLDLFLAAPLVGPDAWVLLSALAVAIGGLHGWLMWLASAGLSRLNLPVRALVTLLFTTALCLHVVARLGAFARLSGAYSLLAIATVASGLLAGLMTTAIVLAFVPSVDHPRGKAFTHRTWAWIPLSLLAAALFVADRQILVGLYPLFHLVLRAASLTTGTLAMLLIVPLVEPSRSARVLRFAPLVSVVSLVIALGVAAFRPAAVFPLELAPWPLLVLTSGRELTDVDLDGYSGVLGGGDCAPFSARINPGASEIVDNGIDDNCLLGDARATKASEAVVDDALPPPTQDIVLITVDSLRPDHMGVYDNAYRARGLSTTPNIDAWAGHETLVFDRAYSTGALTSIALPSLMRGLYPRHLTWSKSYETSTFRLLHTSQEIAAVTGTETIVKMFPVARRDTHLSLAARLQQRGMRTLAVVDDGFCEQLNPGSGLAAGFDEYREVDDLRAHARGDVGATDLALRLLERVPSDKHFFLWVHYFGVHGPDRKHPNVRLDGTSVAQRYDHVVRFFDSQIARLLRALSARAQPPIVVLTADHGEDLSSDTRHHGFSVNDAVLRIPLLVKIPNSVGRHIGAPVSLVDVMPSVLTWTQTRVPAGLDGRSLQEPIEHTRMPARQLIADVWQYDRDSHLFRSYAAAFDGRHKVIYDRMLSSWTIERQGSERLPKRIATDADNPLVRTLVQYIESSGGDLTLSD